MPHAAVDPDRVEVVRARQRNQKGVARAATRRRKGLRAREPSSAVCGPEVTLDSHPNRPQTRAYPSNTLTKASTRPPCPIDALSRDGCCLVCQTICGPLAGRLRATGGRISIEHRMPDSASMPMFQTKPGGLFCRPTDLLGPSLWRPHGHYITRRFTHKWGRNPRQTHVFSSVTVICGTNARDTKYRGCDERPTNGYGRGNICSPGSSNNNLVSDLFFCLRSPRNRSKIIDARRRCVPPLQGCGVRCRATAVSPVPLYAALSHPRSSQNNGTRANGVDFEPFLWDAVRREDCALSASLVVQASHLRACGRERTRSPKTRPLACCGASEPLPLCVCHDVRMALLPECATPGRIRNNMGP